jgi:hypothetical protein
MPGISRLKRLARERAQRKKETQQQDDEPRELSDLSFVNLLADTQERAMIGENQRRLHFNREMHHADARYQTQQQLQQAQAAEELRAEAEATKIQQTICDEKLIRRFHTYFQRSHSQRAEVDEHLRGRILEDAQASEDAYAAAWKLHLMKFEEARQLREEARQNDLRLADARSQVLKDNLPIEIVREIFRFKVDAYVPDHLFIEESRPTSVRKRWVRGLKSVPGELYHDDWTLHRGVPAVFSDYYATIEIDLSTQYAKWPGWVEQWKDVSRAVQRCILQVTGFDNAQIATLAEIAYFFGESPMIQRIHKNPLVYVQDRDRVLNKGTLPNGTKDTTPDEHILIIAQPGEMADGQQEMLMLIKEMARIGSLHRNSRALSREGFRKLVFDWAMGPPDVVLNLAQIISRRAVDLVNFPIQATSYGQWAATQPKSSPRKRLY